MTFEVLDGGLVTTIQDGGRPDWAHLGVPRSGACDPLSLAVANLLVGADATAAAVEMTLVGPTLVARESTVIGLAGADLGGRVLAGRRLAPGRRHLIRAGETITFLGDGPDRRARAYLALAGGIDVPEVLGSRSTCLAAGFGGIDGRPLQAGDVLRGDGGGAVMPRAAIPADDVVWPADPLRDTTTRETILRILPGAAPGIDALLAARWRVGREADRVGLRLDGPPLPDGIAGETLSHGVTWGAIQVPPDGRPIILGVDHQTTGGYPVVAVVISADRPALGQLKAGAEVRFQAVERGEALAFLREQQAALRAGAAALLDATRWDELARSAGG
jgi:antagonist of KipI